jgi:hypothetical protein
MPELAKSIRIAAMMAARNSDSIELFVYPYLDSSECVGRYVLRDVSAVTPTSRQATIEIVEKREYGSGELLTEPSYEVCRFSLPLPPLYELLIERDVMEYDQVVEVMES